MSERYKRLVRLHQRFALAAIVGTLSRGKRRTWGRIKRAISAIEEGQAA